MKVCVPMVVYNHARYVAQAIESVLMQLGDFDLEIIVGDDCSIDGTREVVGDFAARFPDQVKPIYRGKNIGGANNFKNVFDMVDGDYIALLQGDDYWTDPLKLAKQIAFLERNSDCSMCFHDVVMFYNDGSSKPHLFNMGRQKMPRYTLRDLFEGNFIQTCSVVYRAGIVKPIPEWLSAIPMGDWPLHILHAEHGPIGYLDEPMGVYRQQGQSTWASFGLPERIRRSIRAAGMIDTALDLRYHDILKATMTRWSNELVTAYLSDGEPDRAVLAIEEALALPSDPSLLANYLPRYVTLFAGRIVDLIEQRKNAEALSCYDRLIGKLPNVEGMDRIREMMERLKLTLTATR